MEEMRNSAQNVRARSSDDETNSPDAAPLARHKRIDVGAAYRKRRTILACDVCRARRTKCDGKKPTCSFCKENGADCTYQPVRETPASRLETDISAVRAQLDIIQSVLTRAPTFTSDTSSAPSENLGDSPITRIPVMILSDSGFMRVLGLRDDLADELVSREREHSVPINQYKGGFMMVIQQNQALAALNDYHDKVHIWFPYLHPSFKEHFISIISRPLCPSAELCLTLAVIATGCIAKNGPLSYFSLPNIDYANAALEMLPIVLAECSIMSVQCLIAIALYYNTLLKPIQAHDYIMIASLRIQTLLKTKGHDRDPDTLELINRSYWAILLLEAELANPFDFPSSGIRDLNEHTPLPSSFQSSHLPQRDFVSTPSSGSMRQSEGGGGTHGAESYAEEHCNLAISSRYSRDFSVSPLQMQCLGVTHPSEQSTLATFEQVESYYLAEIAMRRMLYRCTTSTRLRQPSKTPTYAPIVAAELVYQLDEWYYHLPACLRFDRSTEFNSNTVPSSPHTEFLRTQFYSCRTGVYWPAAYEAIRDSESTDHVDPAVDMFLHSYAGFMKSAAWSVRLCQPSQWVVYAAIFPMTLAVQKTLSVPYLRKHGPPDLDHCFHLARRTFKEIEGQNASLDYLGELLNEKLGAAENWVNRQE